MVLRTLYRYELKKLFWSKINLIALAGAVIMLLFLVVTSIPGDRPISREDVKELDGRAVDGQLIEELKPAMKVVNGYTVIETNAEREKYLPIIDVVTAVTGYNKDLTSLQETDFYELREQELSRRMEKQRLSEREEEFWRSQEAQVSKPFVFRYHSGPANLLRSFQSLGLFILLLSAVGLSGIYARESADRMNQLLLCSRFGKKELYLIKYAAGLTWILVSAFLLTLAILLPVSIIYGLEGMAEMVQLVKPFCMLPLSLGQMLAMYMGIYLLAAVLFASVTMLLSVITQNQLAVTAGLLGYMLIDLFGNLPERFDLLQKIWMLRPNAVLMNTGFSNYRLIHLAGRLLMNYQAAPVIYFVISIIALLLGRRKYRRLQVGK